VPVVSCQEFTDEDEMQGTPTCALSAAAFILLLLHASTAQDCKSFTHTHQRYQAQQY